MKCLIVIDVQEGLRDDLYNKHEFFYALKQAILSARGKIKIIYIRHIDGYPPLILGNPGFEIVEYIKPIDEIILDKKYNSAFKDTLLKKFLDQYNIDELYITGICTEYCIDTTVKVAFELGYKINIIKEAVSTIIKTDKDSKAVMELYLNDIWPNRFADVISLEDFRKCIL